MKLKFDEKLKYFRWIWYYDRKNTAKSTDLYFRTCNSII